MGTCGPSPAAAQLQLARAWTSAASSSAGVPQPLQLLPSLPISANPAWCRAPSFAAAAALLVPPSGGGSSGVQHAPSAADLAAAAAVVDSAGLTSRVLWAAGCQQLHFVYSTPYDHLVGLAHRQAQLLPMTLANLAPRHGGSSTQAAAAAGSDAAAEQRRQAERIFAEVAADQRAGGLRLLGWLLSHLFRWLFNSELYVDVEGLARLRQLYLQGGGAEGQPGGASIVYIPAHKSHLDYLMLSYVLFGAGLPCPHIAAGANLRLPLVGRLLRACGAFFIRRTSRGASDSHLYKAVLAGYVHALLQAGHSLEFFIEGGRSRDGRVNPPKLGMLRMVVDAVAAGDVTRPVFVVPTAMNYDAVIEEGSLAAQLAGAAKKGESLAGLAGTCWGILANALRSRWRRYLLGLGAGAQDAVPADHPSKLAPLLAHPADVPISDDALASELTAAIAGTEAVKSGAASATSMNCLRDPLYEMLPLGSKPKIAIVVGYNAPKGSTNQDNMYARSLRDKREYAAKHGYDVVVYGNTTILEGRDLDYLKWVGALSRLRQYDWLWMVDLDTIILNHTVPLETFLDPRFDMIITRDCNGINTGTQFIHNSTWAFMFIAEVCMHSGAGIRDGPGDWPTWWSWHPEQAVVWKLMEEDRIRNHVKVLPQRLFNSYAGQACDPEGTVHEGDFMVHFAGPGGKPRFNDYWSKHGRLDADTAENGRNSL